jgi:hypothetical protein
LTHHSTARLPDLLIVGAPKSGTTTLTHWLRDHPQVAFSEKKELEFFDLRFDRGLDWYLEQLPSDPGDRLVVEATPTYLSDPEAPARIARCLPAARFVAVLREPVARAWSQYWFFVQLGLERRTWEQALAEECEGENPGYLWRGRYGEQLARWETLVGPERLQVLLFDDLVEDPDSALASVCAFAGIEARPAPSRDAVNPTRLPRSARVQRLLQHPDAGPVRRRLFAWNGMGRPVPRLTDQERQRVGGPFQDDLLDLQERLGRPLPDSWFGSAVAPPLRTGS